MLIFPERFLGWYNWQVCACSSIFLKLLYLNFKTVQFGLKIVLFWGFRDGPVVKALPLHYRGYGWVQSLVRDPTSCMMQDASQKIKLNFKILPSSDWNKEIFVSGWFISGQSLSPVQFFVTPMACSKPGLPAHHQLPELAQTHVHQVSDAIQPSHPLLPPSPAALNLSQHHGPFQRVHSSHQVAKVLELQHQSFQWVFRTDFL